MDGLFGMGAGRTLPAPLLPRLPMPSPTGWARWAPQPIGALAAGPGWGVGTQPGCRPQALQFTGGGLGAKQQGGGGEARWLFIFRMY